MGGLGAVCGGEVSERIRSSETKALCSAGGVTAFVWVPPFLSGAGGGCAGGGVGTGGTKGRACRGGAVAGRACLGCAGVRRSTQPHVVLFSGQVASTILV